MKRVLVIEDNDRKAERIQCALVTLGFECIVHAKGCTHGMFQLHCACEETDEEPFDLLVLDMGFGLDESGSAGYSATMGLSVLDTIEWQNWGVHTIICSCDPVEYDEYDFVLGSIVYNSSVDLTQAFRELLQKLKQPKFTVRMLCEADSSRIKELEEQSDFKISDMLDSEGFCWGVFAENQLIGFCTCGGADGVLDGCNTEDLLISDVFVIPSWREKGAASTLLRHVIESEAIDCSVFVMPWDDSVIGLYTRLGFKPYNDHTDYLVLQTNSK